MKFLIILLIIFVRTHYGDNNKENVQLTPMMQYNTQLNHNTNQQNLAMIEDFLRPFVPESNHKSNSNISPFLNPMESNEVSLHEAIRVLNGNIRRWNFVEAQLLEPNVQVSMAEIFVPLGYLSFSLRALGNIFFVQNYFEAAISVLERACPLMEHLPSAKSSSKNRNLESPCFSLLRKIYNRMPALKDHKEDISARFNDLREPYEHLVSQTEIDIVPDDALKNLLRSIYNVKKTHSLLGTLFVTGQSIDLNSKLSGSAGRVTANRHASNTNVERISPELLNSLRASSESALPHFMDRRTDSRFRYLAPSHHDQGSADYDEAAFENQLRSSLAEGDDIAEDLLVVIETTTGITRDLEIYLRRFVLEKDVERRSVVDAVKRYRDDLKLALDKSSQSLRAYFFDDMGLTEAYHDILLKAFVEGVDFVAQDLQTIKERLAIPHEDSLREALALASDELSAMSSLSLPNNPLHSNSNSLVKALASLSREERNRLVVLSAFEKGLQSQEADFREFAEQVKIHQRYGRLTSGVIQQISTLDDSAIDILPEFANSADNERLVLEATKSSTTIDIYRDVCKDLSPLVWLTKRRDQVRNQRLRQKGKKLKKSSSFFGSNRNDRDRFLDTDGLSDDEDEDDEYEKEVLQNTRVDADLNDVGRIRSQRSGKSRDDSPPFFDLSIVVAIFGVIFSSCGLIYEAFYKPKEEVPRGDTAPATTPALRRRLNKKSSIQEHIYFWCQSLWERIWPSVKPYTEDELDAMDSPKGVSPRSGVSEKNRQPPVYHHPFEMFLNSFSSVIDDITENIRIRINSIIDPLADSIIHFFDQKWNFIWRSMKVSNADKKFVDELSIADEVHNGLEQTINTSESPSLISVSASVASTTLPMASATRKKGKTKGGTSSVFNTTGKTASVGNHSRGLSVSDHNSATTGLTDTLEKVYTSTPPAILPDGNKSLHAVSSTNSIAESDESAPVVAFKSPDRDNLAETHLYTAFSSLDEYENQNETDSFTVISKKATKGKKGVVSNTGAGFAKAVGKEIVESSTNNQNSLPLTKTTSVAGPISSSSVPNPVAFAIIPPTTSRSKHTLVHSESTASHQHSSSISDEMSSTDTHARVTSNTKPSINAWQQPLAQKMKVVSSLGGPSNILGSNLLDNNLTAADITKYGDTSISSSISTTKQHNVVVDSPAKSAAPRNDQRVTMPHSISSDTVDNADLDLNTINFEEMGPGDDDLQGIVNSILPPGYRGIGQQWLDSEIGLVPRPSVIHARNGGLMNNLPNGQLGLPSSLLQSPDIGMGPLKQYNGSLATSVNLTTGQLSVESRSQSLSVGGSKSIPYQRKALQQSGPSMTIPPNNNSYSFSQPRFLSQQLNEASPAPLSMNEHYFGQNEYPNGVISQVNGLTDDFDMSEMTPQGATLSASAPSFSPGNLAYFGTQSPQFTNASAFPGGLYDTSSRHPSSVFDLTPIGPPTAASIPFLSLGRSVYAQQSSLGGGMPLLSSQGITQSPPAYDSHSATSSAMHLMGSTMSNNMHPINDISHEFLAVDVTSVTLIIMVKVALESQDNIVLVKIQSNLFDQPIAMLRSNANPELWGLSLNLPLDIQLFQYRYVLYDSESLPYFDSESMRTIDVPFQLASAVTIGEINVEDKIVTVMPFRG